MSKPPSDRDPLSTVLTDSSATHALVGHGILTVGDIRQHGWNGLRYLIGDAHVALDAADSLAKNGVLLKDDLEPSRIVLSPDDSRSRPVYVPVGAMTFRAEDWGLIDLLGERDVLLGRNLDRETLVQTLTEAVAQQPFLVPRRIGSDPNLLADEVMNLAERTWSAHAERSGPRRSKEEFSERLAGVGAARVLKSHFEPALAAGLDKLPAEVTAAQLQTMFADAVDSVLTGMEGKDRKQAAFLKEVQATAARYFTAMSPDVGVQAGAMLLESYSHPVSAPEPAARRWALR